MLDSKIDVHFLDGSKKSCVIGSTSETINTSSSFTSTYITGTYDPDDIDDGTYIDAVFPLSLLVSNATTTEQLHSEYQSKQFYVVMQNRTYTMDFNAKYYVKLDSIGRLEIRTLVTYVRSYKDENGEIVFNTAEQNISGTKQRATFDDFPVTVSSDVLAVRNVSFLSSTRTPDKVNIGFKFEQSGSSPFYYIRDVIQDEIKPVTDNPWGDDGEPDGGNGNFDPSSDPIPFPDLPQNQIANSGFVAMYEMSQLDMRNLSAFLWSPNFFDNIIKVIQNPWDLIISNYYMPIPSSMISGSNKEMQLGNLNSTGVIAKKISQQYLTVDCGSITVSEYAGGYYDYAPFTQISLFLPFFGNVAIDVDDIMTRTISIQYRIDLATGNATILVKYTGGGLDSVLNTYSCSLSAGVPLSSANYGQLYLGLATIAGSAFGGAIAGGAMAASVGASGGAMAGQIAKGGLKSGAQSALSNIGAKPQYHKSNSMGGASGFMGILYPYLEITRPIQHRPKDYNNYDGYTLNVTYDFADLKGYSEIVKTTLENIGCTKTEENEIYELLYGGVYF